MERRVRAKREGRANALRRRRKARVEAAALAFGDAWATVVYVEGRGYQIAGLLGSKTEAAASAARATAAALDARAHRPSPYEAVFATPVAEPDLHQRGAAYYAAFENKSASRSVFLFASPAAAERASAERGLTYLGGPVALPRRE